MRECEDSLTDIHKVHSHIIKVGVRIFIENPHDLAGIHCGTTAHCDNAVRLKHSHCSSTGSCRSERWIWLYIVEAGMYDSHLI